MSVWSGRKGHAPWAAAAGTLAPQEDAPLGLTMTAVDLKHLGLPLGAALQYVAEAPEEAAAAMAATRRQVAAKGGVCAVL